MEILMVKVKRGDKVRYDSRASGIKTGVVGARVNIAPYSGVGPGPTYFNISGTGTLVPAQDIIEVIA